MSYDYAERRPYANPITLGGYRSADRDAAPAADPNFTKAADALLFLNSRVGYDDPVSSPKYNGTVPGAAAPPVAAVSARVGSASGSTALTARARPLSSTAGRRLPTLLTDNDAQGVSRSVDGHGEAAAVAEKAPGFLTQHNAHDGTDPVNPSQETGLVVRQPHKPVSVNAVRTTVEPVEEEGTATDAAATAELQGEVALAPLANPIELNPTTHYHTSQQNALNAQLRGDVEQLLNDWIIRLSKLQSLMDGYPKDCALTNFSVTEAVKSYYEMYRCTDVPALTRDELATRHELHCTRDDLLTVESLPPLSLEGVQRALDNLLNAKTLLSHSLDDHHRALISLDAFAKMEMILPSATAVALHERHHYNAGEYAMIELRKSQDPLDKMEERVETARVQKEMAIDDKKPGVALGNLHAQADYSNDLLLLNKARMAVVKQHEDDVREYRIDVTQLIKDAKEACDAFQKHVAQFVPKLNHDMRALQDGSQTAHSALADMEETERREEAKTRAVLLDIDKEEKEKWNQVRTLLRELHECADKKDKLAKDRLSRREIRGREFAAVEQLLKAQEEELERQLQCQDIVHRWSKGTELYKAYVEAYVPKLLMDINESEIQHDQLAAKEAEEYVRRYEMFTYAAEEARAKRNVQLDRMRLTERTLTHNLSVADEAMDPNVEGTEKRLGEVKEEAEEAKAYVEFMLKLEGDRRAEVEPYLERLMARVVANNAHKATPQIQAIPPTNATARTVSLDDSEAANKERDSDVFRSVSPGTTLNNVNNRNSNKRGYATPGTAARALALYPEEAEDTYGEDSDMTNVMMTHPHLAARYVGIQHEFNHLEKQRQLVSDEMTAVDAQKEGVRRSQKQLAALESRYKNGDDIRALLDI